jgi:hypothetical protein
MATATLSSELAKTTTIIEASALALDHVAREPRCSSPSFSASNGTDIDSDGEEDNSLALWDDNEGNKGKDDEAMKKERNRMHAKLTRDRKKMFISKLQQMINVLERRNGAMMNRLILAVPKKVS